MYTLQSDINLMLIPFIIDSYNICMISVFLFQPPVQMFGVEGRYATALYSAASKQKQLETVEKELTAFGVRITTYNAHFRWIQNTDWILFSPESQGLLTLENINLCEQQNYDIVRF